MKGKAFDLENRLIAFAVRVIRVAEALPKTSTGNHVRNQKPESSLDPLTIETNELISIFVASLKTAANKSG